MTIQDRFPTISGPFPTISGRFVNRPASSDSFPASSRPILGRPTPFLTQGRHNRGPPGRRNRSIVRTVPDHSRAVQNGATGSNTQEKGNTHTTPTISFTFHTNFHPTTDHFMALSDQVSPPHADHSGAVQQGTARPPKHGQPPHSSIPTLPDHSRAVQHGTTGSKVSNNSNTHRLTQCHSGVVPKCAEEEVEEEEEKWNPINPARGRG